MRMIVKDSSKEKKEKTETTILKKNKRRNKVWEKGYLGKLDKTK